MLGWFVRIFRALLRWKRRDVLRLASLANPLDAKRVDHSGSLPPVPHEMPIASALASEQPTVPVFGLYQGTPPPADAGPPINLSAKPPKVFDNVEMESVEVARNDSLLSLPSQVVLSEPTVSAGAERVSAVEAYDVVPWIDPPAEPQLTETLAGALVSIAPMAAQVVPHDDRAAAAPEEAEAPEPEEPQGVPERPAHDKPAAPISNASADTDHERNAGPEPEAVPLQPSSDETIGVLLPGGIVQPRPSSRYRPRLREPTIAASPSNASLRGNSGARPLDADLMLIFQPGGWDIALSLLLRRSDGMPEEVAVSIGGEAIRALAIDQTYFEPLSFPDVAFALQDGITVETIGALRRRWMRTGRALHIFSERLASLDLRAYRGPSSAKRT
jgi:hypothetical protein